MKNKFIAIIIAITFCFLSSFSFCSVGFSNVVHALDTFPLPQKHWANTAFGYYFPEGIDYENFCDDFFNYSGLNASDYFLILSTGTAVYPSGRMYIYPYERSSLVTAYSDSTHRYLYLKSYPTTIYYCNNSTLTGFVTQSYSDFSRYPRSFCYDNTNQVYRQCVLETNGNWSNLEYNDIPVCVINETVLSYTPSSYTLYGLDLAINETSFYEWIIENNKLSELPSYITQSKLLSFIKFYNNFGGSFKNFITSIPDWFSQMNIINQSAENVNILKSSMDRLYQEYLNSFWREVGKGNAELLPHHRRNIQTQTTDDDLTLVTDDNTDTLDISILRDILRGIIQVSNQIGNGTNSIINKLDQLDFTVNLSNGGGTVTDLSVLYEYDINDFDDDFETFEENVSTITAVPLSYVQTINSNSLMPENMLSDKQNLSVTIPVINGFTVNEDCTEYETNTDTFTFYSTDYPWLDTIVKKMKRFASIMLIIGYLIHLRFKIADIVRGE